MRGGHIKFMKLAGFLFASVCAWYLGSLLAYIIPEESVVATIENIQKVGEKPVLRAPPPKRQKCDHWTPCSTGSFAYRIISGGGRDKMAKICFEDKQLISEDKKNAGRGINIAIVDYDTGKCIDAKCFDMYEGEFSGNMTDFIKKAPKRSLLLLVTHDDGSTKLKEDAKKVIADLGSKEIRNLHFRSSWAFITAKGFKLPDNLEKEKINHSDNKKNRYDGWPAEIQIEGCIPRNLH